MLTRLKFGTTECLFVKPSDTKLLSEVSTAKLRVPLERLSEGNVKYIYIYKRKEKDIFRIINLDLKYPT